jgi:hypothetical protein
LLYKRQATNCVSTRVRVIQRIGAESSYSQSCIAVETVNLKMGREGSRKGSGWFPLACSRHENLNMWMTKFITTYRHIYTFLQFTQGMFSILFSCLLSSTLHHLSRSFCNKLNIVKDEAKKTWERNGKWEKWVGETVTEGNKRRGDVDRCVDKVSESLREGVGQNIILTTMESFFTP